MDTKKIIVIAIGILLAVVAILGILDKDPKEVYSGNFTTTLPVEENNVAAVAGLNSLVMLVDHSGSMKGYVDHRGHDVENNKFISTCSDFLTNVESKCNTVCSVSYNGKMLDKDTFRDILRTNRAFERGSTKVDELIAEACRYANDTSACVILSDMVLSYGIIVLKEEGKNYNRESLDGLHSEIYSEVTKVKDAGYHIMIVQYLSDFNGEYYYTYTENDLNKNKHYKGKLMSNRPYYMMLVGKKEYLLELYNKCMKKSEFVYTSFDVQEGKDFHGFSIDEKDNRYWIKCEADIQETGTFYTEEDYGEEITEFNVVYNGFVLPEYIKEKDISLSVTEGFECYNVSYDKEKKSLGYILKLPKHNTIKKQEVCVKTIVEQNVAWEDVTMLDDVDKELKDIEGKTWAFSTIVNAIDEAYFGEGKREASKVVSTAKIKFINN